MKKRRYGLESKMYAVRLSYEMNSALSAAWELGISLATIYRWRKKFSSIEKDGVMDKNSVIPERQTELDNNFVAESEQFFFLWWFFT